MKIITNFYKVYWKVFNQLYKGNDNKVIKMLWFIFLHLTPVFLVMLIAYLHVGINNIRQKAIIDNHCRQIFKAEEERRNG